MAGLKEFLFGPDAATSGERPCKNTTNGTASQSNLDELAEAFWVVKDSPDKETMKVRLKKYVEMKGAVVREVYLYDTGSDDFVLDRDHAELMAHPGFRVRKSLAREIDGKLFLMSVEDIRQYYKSARKG